MSRDLITFRCPQCQAALSLPANLAGAQGPCLYCETEIIGPNPALAQPARLAAPPQPAPPRAPAPLELGVSSPLPASAASAQAHARTEPQRAPVASFPFPETKAARPRDPFPAETGAALPGGAGFPDFTRPASSPAGSWGNEPLPGSSAATAAWPQIDAPAAAPAHPRLPFPSSRGLEDANSQASQPLPPLSRQAAPLTQPQEPWWQSPQFPQSPAPQHGFPAETRPEAPAYPHSSQDFGEYPAPGYSDYQYPSGPAMAPGAQSRPWHEKARALPVARAVAAVRELGNALQKSPLAPLAVAGVLIILLVIFGVYLWRDFNKLGPGDAGGPVAEAPAAPAAPAAPMPAAPMPAPEATGPANTANTAGPAGLPLAPEGAAPAPPDRATETTGGLLDAPIAALQSFVNAPTWEERLKYSIQPEVVRPLMEIYYRSYPDGIVVPDAMRFQHSETDPDTGHRFFVFHVTTEEVPDGFPVLVEESADGLRVDWETFVEFKDHLFHRFATSPSPGKLGAFHLIMRKAHYFGEEFPEMADLTAYRLDPPIPNQEAYAFALSDSQVNKDLQQQVSWGMNFTPFVELRWAKSQNGTDYLQIVGLLHMNWRNRR